MTGQPSGPMTGRPSEVVGYSERGLVNALVGFMRRDSKRLECFLRCCEWNGSRGENEELFDGDELLKAFKTGVAKVTYIVETSFAHFGDPDLIIVIHTADRRWRFFVEAKVVAYLKNAKSNAQGMRQEGYNSAINGQLSLKYRLARALAVYSESDARLQEPDSLFDAAKRELHDPSQTKDKPKGRPRRLEKEANLKLLVEEHLMKKGKQGDVKQSPEEFLKDTWFVALTHEGKGQANPVPTDSQDDKSPLYFKSESPVLADTAWKHTGWSSWARLQEKLAGLEKDPDFSAVWKIVSYPP